MSNLILVIKNTYY